MTPDQRANVQRVIDDLTEVGEAIGGWTGQTDAGLTGVSYHARFERKVSVDMALRWVDRLAQCPAMLVDACRKLTVAEADRDRWERRACYVADDDTDWDAIDRWAGAETMLADRYGSGDDEARWATIDTNASPELSPFDPDLAAIELGPRRPVGFRPWFKKRRRTIGTEETT